MLFVLLLQRTPKEAISLFRNFLTPILQPGKMATDLSKTSAIKNISNGVISNVIGGIFASNSQIRW